MLDALRCGQMFARLPVLFKQVILALLLWTLWYTAAPLTSAAASGYCVIVHAFVMFVLATRVARTNQRDLRALPQMAMFCFTAGFVVWAASDFLWAINYFISPSSSKSPLGITVTSLCAASYVLSAAGIVAAIEGRLRDFLDARVALTALVVSTTIILAMLLYPYLSDGTQDRWSLFSVAEMVAVGTAYVLLNLAIAVMLSSRTVEWSIYGAGVMCWVLGDTAIRIGKILDDTINADGFSVLCSFGIYAALFALASEDRRGRIDRVDFRSLFTTSKFGSVATIFVCLLAFLLSQTNNLDAVRLITLCCGLASFGSILLSTFLVAQIRRLSYTLGSVLKGDIGSEDDAKPNVSSLPLELREHYDYVFASSVREQKARALQRTLDAKHQTLRRVAHNILSPVSALRSQLADLNVVPEESRVIMKTAIHEISDMANSLSDAGKSQEPETTIETVMLSSVVDMAVSQRRQQYRFLANAIIDCDLSPRAYGLFSRVNARELKSIVSNLVNNAVEAFSEVGTVTVTLRSSARSAEIVVADNGRGIPADILPKVGTNGFTFGKAKGSGIGMHHAKTLAESWGGSVHIESTLGVGTTVVVRLPLAPPPPWFVPAIQLRRDGAVVVADDNPAIHQLWTKRLAAGGRSPEVVHLFSTEALRNWHTDNAASALRALYLVDLEFTQGAEDGLALIRSLDIAEQSILVTSHHDSEDVRDACEVLGVGLLPKTVAALVPIRPPAEPSAGGDVPYDAIFIDNEALYRNVWTKSAREHNKRVLVFSSVEEFRVAAKLVDRRSPIFIDSDLGDGILGEQEAQELRHGLGFGEIYLATAHPWSDFKDIPWLTGVVGKNPPWQPDPWQRRKKDDKRPQGGASC